MCGLQQQHILMNYRRFTAFFTLYVVSFSHLYFYLFIYVVSSTRKVLKPYLDSGQLDMAIFDAVNDSTIKLTRSGIELGPGKCVNPICVVANYLFDTLCHDIFQVRHPMVVLILCIQARYSIVLDCNRGVVCCCLSHIS